jgi:hypothetical protein
VLKFDFGANEFGSDLIRTRYSRIRNVNV